MPNSEQELEIVSALLRAAENAEAAARGEPFATLLEDLVSKPPRSGGGARLKSFGAGPLAGAETELAEAGGDTAPPESAEAISKAAEADDEGTGLQISHPCEVLDQDIVRDRSDCFLRALVTALVPEELRDNSRRVAVVYEEFIYVKRTETAHYVIMAPKGYETDFASIPRVFQFLINPFGEHAEAAVIHDWLYSIGEIGDAAGRADADRIFSHALKYLKVDPLRRLAMYGAVRLFGGSSYGRRDEYDQRFRDLKTLARESPPRFSRETARRMFYCKKAPPPRPAAA